MRKFALFLLIMSAIGVAAAAEIWRWKDPNGVVHYSDQPVPGAERLSVTPAPKPGSVITPPPPPRAAAAAASVDPEAAPTIVPYRRCVLSEPTNDQVFFNVSTIGATLDLQPPLQGDHRVQMLMNGKAVTDWPGDAAQFMLVDVHRGSYTLTGRVIDSAGRALCTSPTINFHLRQATVQPRPTPR